jgi:hypothetical protein
MHDKIIPKQESKRRQIPRRDGLRRQKPRGKTAMFCGGFAEKTYTKCLNPIAKNPAIWYNEKRMANAILP